MSDADEMILAGSRPAKSNPMDDLHSRTSTVLLVDSLIFAYLAFVFTGIAAISILPGIFFMAVWLGYRKKAAWAYWFCPMVMGGVTLIFSIMLLLQLMGLFSGVGGSIFLIVILAWAIYSSVRFVRIHFHPVYKMGYSGYSIYDEGIKLEPNEMLAACPTCLAVLAVNPLMLSPEDRCPHCDSPLVLGQEEE